MDQVYYKVNEKTRLIVFIFIIFIAIEFSDQVVRR